MAVVRGETGVEIYGYNQNFVATGKHISFSINEEIPLFNAVVLKSKLILFFGRDNKAEVVTNI